MTQLFQSIECGMGIPTQAGPEPLPAVKADSGSSGHSAYRLGRLDRATRRHQPLARSGDAAIYDSHDLMNRRTRDLYINNALWKRAVDVLRDIIVGTGIHGFADPVDYSFGWNLEKRPKSELFGSFDYAIETDQKFMRWAEDPKQCHIEGSMCWFDMMPLALTENCNVGDVLFLESMRKNQEVPLAYQMIEREQLDVSRDRPAEGKHNAIVNGFEFDSLGRELGAYIYDAHPHDGMMGIPSANFKSKFVPSSRYIHLFKRIRPSQHIGATWLHATGQTLIDRDKYMLAELRAAAKAALFVLYAKLKNPGSHGMGMHVDPDYDSSDYGQHEISLGTDPIVAPMHTDESLEVIEPARPNDSAQYFMDLVDHDMAGATNLSFYSQTGRFEKTNYGGFRGAMNLEESQAVPIQEWIGRQLVLPVRRRWNELAVALGHIDNLSPAQFRRERHRYSKFDVIGPGRNLLDADKETEGILAKMRGGFTTLKRECARLGLHWIAVLQQIHLENHIAGELGIVLDHSKGQGGQTDKSTRKSDGGNGRDETESRGNQWGS